MDGAQQDTPRLCALYTDKTAYWRGEALERLIARDPVMGNQEPLVLVRRVMVLPVSLLP